jgi:hypothetical protein
MKASSGLTETSRFAPRAAERRPPPSPLTTDQHWPFGIPADEVQCDALLGTAGWRMNEPAFAAVRSDLVRDLARFLGASSRVWTTPRRLRLEQLLIDAGPYCIGPVFDTVAAMPRDEVMDQAVSVLAAAATAHEEVAETLASLGDAPPAVNPPAVREVILRSLVRASGPIARQAKLRIACRLATDPSPAVRDAAVQALAAIGKGEGHEIVLDLLKKLRAAEREPLVLESIDEAADTVRTR